jgi:hypothetical protein
MELERRQFKIVDLYSYALLMPIVGLPYVGFATEVLQYPDKKITEYGYYKWFRHEAKMHRALIKQLKTEKDVRDRMVVFKKLVLSIRDNGVIEDEIEVNRVTGSDAPLYGTFVPIMVREKRGKYYICEGQHRVSILFALGEKYVNCIMYKEWNTTN